MKRPRTYSVLFGNETPEEPSSGIYWTHEDDNGEMVGGKDKTRIRNATPPEFRDVLIDIARRTRIDAARHAA